MVPKNDLQAIERARAVTTPRPSPRDGSERGVHPAWLVVFGIVGFLAGWYSLFLAIVSRP